MVRNPMVRNDLDLLEQSSHAYYNWRMQARNTSQTQSTGPIAANNPVLCGADVGQVSDYTAIILSEIEKREDPSDGTLKKHYIVRLIERVPLGSSYQSVVDQCAQLYEKLNKRPRFIVDASGARPICDLLRNANIPILPIQITPGTQSRIEHGYGYVSKLELTTLLQLISSANQIHLSAESKFSKAIRDVARRFELKITDAGALTFGAEGSSKDDLIMALCYVLWFGERTRDSNRPRVRCF